MKYDSFEQKEQFLVASKKLYRISRLLPFAL